MIDKVSSSPEPLKSPVLFLVFNRPDTTRRVFEAIRQAQPSQLFISADGPREDKPGETDRCLQTRRIVDEGVDWDCQIHRLYRADNLGCKVAVSRAIDWFFEHIEEGIILEDDCLAHPTFFRFCEELLHRYADEDQVMTISGNNFQPKRRTDNSYYFSKYMHCWGWASWRRAWKHFDLEMEEWPQLKKENFLAELFKLKKAQKYWEHIFDRVYAGEIDTWGYIWTYSIWNSGGVNILPEVNLVSNIGFGEEGTHTRNKDSNLNRLKTETLNFPLKHPDNIVITRKADKFMQINHLQRSLFKKVLSKLKRKILR
jgi:hypothetical protein